MNTEVVPYTSTIQEYSKTAAALAELEQRYKGVLFQVDTKQGMADAIKSRAEIRGYRLELEKTRVAIKAPALKRTQEIDSEARRITGVLESLENPIADQIKADERRKEAEAKAKVDAEAARLASDERARKDAEEKVLAAQRAEIARQQAELAEGQRKAAAAAEAERARIAQEQREARDKIEAEQRAARLAMEAERKEAARIADEAAAKVRAEQAAEAKRQREAEEKIAAERRAVEEDARRLRMEAESKERAEREAAEAKRREEERLANELKDGWAMLTMFVQKYGKRDEFKAVAKAIGPHLKPAI